MAASNKLTNSGINIVEIFTKLSHILAIFGFILHLIGFATPFWRVLPFRWKGLNDEDEDNLLGFDEGLWRKCANGLCSSVDVAGRDWLQAVRVFESIALISSMVAIATVLFQMMVNKFSKNKFVFLVNIISCFATALFMLLGVITYGASVNIGLSWSLGLATVGGLLLGIAGGLLLVAFVKHQSAPF